MLKNTSGLTELSYIILIFIYLFTNPYPFWVNLEHILLVLVKYKRSVNTLNYPII